MFLLWLLSITTLYKRCVSAFCVQVVLELHSVIFYHICLWIQTCQLLTAIPSSVDMFALFEKVWLCWRLYRHHMTCFCFKEFWIQIVKIQTSHMLTAEPSSYDTFESCHMLTAQPSLLAYFYFQSLEKHVIWWRYSRQHNRTFSKSANMSTDDGIAVNRWHVWIHRHIW